MQLDVLQDRDVEQVLETGLVEAVQIGVFQNAVRILAAEIEMALEDDPVLRQRAGLVRAQHVHRPEVLDRIEALDDDLLSRHRHRAFGQIDRHDHRQQRRRSRRVSILEIWDDARRVVRLPGSLSLK